MFPKDCDIECSFHLCFGKQFSRFQMKFLSNSFLSLSLNVWPKSIKNSILNSFSVQVLTYYFAKWRETRKTEPLIWQQLIGFSHRYHLFPFKLLPPAAFSPIPAWFQACWHSHWQALHKRLEESGMLKKRRLQKPQPWPSTGRQHSWGSNNPPTPLAHLMVGLFPKLITDSTCASPLPQECWLWPACSCFWGLLGNISFRPLPVFSPVLPSTTDQCWAQGKLQIEQWRHSPRVQEDFSPPLGLHVWQSA